MGTFVGTSANGGNVTALTTANSAAITWPTVQAGDLAILAWTMQNTATPTDPTSQAFTLVGTVDDGSCRSRVLKRICTGSESGTITGWSNSIQNRQTAVLFVVRGFTDIAGATSASEPGTTTTHDCPAIGTGNGAATGDSVIVIGTDRSGATTTATPPAGWAKRTTSEFGLAASGGTYTGVADDGLSTGQTMPVDPAGWVMASGSTAVTWTLALRPAPTAIVGTDSTTLSEGTTALQRQSSPSDSATAAETSAIAAATSSTDTASLGDQSQLTVGASVTDTAALGEASSLTVQTAKTAADTGTLTEGAALQQQFARGDSITTDDQAAITATASAADTANLSDLANLTVSLAPSDAASLAESSAIEVLTAKTGTDAGALTEVSQFEQQFALADAITGSEQAALAAAISTADAAGLDEGAAVAGALVAADTVAMTESSSLQVISRVTTRPNLGTTTRPNSGTTPRPDLGVTERP